MTEYVNERDPVPDRYHIGQPVLRSDRLSPIHHQIVFYWIVIFSTSLSLSSLCLFSLSLSSLSLSSLSLSLRIQGSKWQLQDCG